MLAALLLLAACGQIQTPEAALPEETLETAATYGTISGAVFDGNTSTKVAGADVFLYRWNGSDWISLGKKATTNSYGNYTISGVLHNRYYYVGAGKVYGNCLTMGYLHTFHGKSPWFWHSSTSRVNVRLYYTYTMYC